jgi:hypothetical protein
MDMIDDVRKTVMFILNKDNNGYITPAEFNLFAKQAQLEIFEQLFYDYTNWINKKNANLARDGYSNIQKQIRETIDIFNVQAALTYDSINAQFNLPANAYYLNYVYYNSKEIEFVQPHKIDMLNASKLTAPSVTYPAYYQLEDNIKVYPTSIISGVSARYIKYPSDPNWTYTTVAGSPIFNSTAVDYNDFELPLSNFNDLVYKIVTYCGVNIREMDVANFATNSDNLEQNKQS